MGEPVPISRRAFNERLLETSPVPAANGLELISFIKNNPRYSHIPLIIVSTERSEEDRKRGIALGALAYITKPFRAQELQEVVKKALLHEGL